VAAEKRKKKNEVSEVGGPAKKKFQSQPLSCGNRSGVQECCGTPANAKRVGQNSRGKKASYSRLKKGCRGKEGNVKALVKGEKLPFRKKKILASQEKKRIWRILQPYGSDEKRSTSGSVGNCVWRRLEKCPNDGGGKRRNTAFQEGRLQWHAELENRDTRPRNDAQTTPTEYPCPVQRKGRPSRGGRKGKRTRMEDIHTTDIEKTNTSGGTTFGNHPEKRQRPLKTGGYVKKFASCTRRLWPKHRRKKKAQSLG